MSAGLPTGMAAAPASLQLFISIPALISSLSFFVPQKHALSTRDFQHHADGPDGCHCQTGRFAVWVSSCQHVFAFSCYGCYSQGLISSRVPGRAISCLNRCQHLMIPGHRDSRQQGMHLCPEPSRSFFHTKLIRQS